MGQHSLGSGIGLFLLGVIPYALAFLLRIIIKATMIVIAVELIVRAALAPIALADVYGDNLRPHAVTYLKNFAATCLQMACIVGIIMAFSILNSVMMTRDPQVAEVMATIEQYTTAENRADISDRIRLATRTEHLSLTPNAADEEDEEVAKYSKEEIEAHAEGLTSTPNEQVGVARQALELNKEEGKALYKSIFSMSRMISFMAMALALILAITKTRDIARMIVGF